MTKPEIIQTLMAVATFVNSAILWPLVRALGRTQRDHHQRLERLEK